MCGGFNNKNLSFIVKIIFLIFKGIFFVKILKRRHLIFGFSVGCIKIDFFFRKFIVKKNKFTMRAEILFADERKKK